MTYQILSHDVLFEDPFSYCSHPHVAQLEQGRWVLVFNRAPRRAQLLHPPQDPLFANYGCVSTDEGRTWSPPVPVPDYNWMGMECAGLTACGGDRVILNQWQFEWLTAPAVEHGPQRRLVHGPADFAARLRRSHEIGQWSGAADAPERAFPWYLGAGGKTWVHLSDDGGWTFGRSRQIDTSPFTGGYGMRGGQVLPDGSIILPMTDMPDYHTIFAIRSRDRGETWEPPFVIASVPELDFEEPGGFVTDAGRVVLLLRETKSRTLYQVFSDDCGKTWSAPQATGHGEYPANPFRLADGRVAVVVGRREPPFGIRVYLWDEAGQRFRWEEPIIARDLANKDLGYATAAVRRDGIVALIYYARDERGITAIHQTLLSFARD
ncbi:MAG: sialidase family protein [Alsobacter sp.]